VQSDRRAARPPIGLLIVTLLAYVFLYSPIAVLVALSFNSSRFSTIWQGFTWHWYGLAWRDAELIASLRMSLIVAVTTTLISTIVGTAAAIALVRSRVKFKSAIDGLMVLPVIIPEIVIGFSTAALFGLASIAFGLGTVIATHVAFSISYVVFIVRARLAGLGVSFEEAAMDLGATPLQAFLKVTLPLLGPAMISSALLVFTLSLDDYVITSFVAGPGTGTLPLKIYSMVKTGVTPEINAISTILLGVTLAFVVVSEKMSSGKMSRSVALVAVAGIMLLGGFAVGGRRAAPRGGELNIFIWSNYLPEEVIANFEQRYDARINVELYDSNEALLAKLQSGSVSYDIIVPSDYMVTVLKEQGLIQELNRDYLTNFSNLEPRLTGLPFDPDNRYSVPYMWGTTGIAYRRDKVNIPVESWEALWNPVFKDRISMLDDVRETFGAALKMTGHSLNSKDLAAIEQAARLLERQKPLVKAYDSGGFDQMLLSGDVWLAQSYSGQIARAMMENPMIRYVIPREGCTTFVDNLCVPGNAKHRDLAYEFINFVLDPGVAADIANGTGYSTANRAARAFIRPDMLANEAAYPPQEALDRCELITDIGPTISVYDRYWTEIKSK
jgi:spermidine/putrescine transport system permease protein